jgi:tetrahydromethanopterin S-methyltransferase subunit E
MPEHESPTISSVSNAKVHTGARKIFSHHPVGTGFGSSVGAAVVSVAAGAAGAGSVVVYTCLATGVVIGGWAGHTISKRRSKSTDAEVLRRRTRTIRLLKVTRMLRRRNVA